MLTLTVPAALALILLGRPLIQLMYHRGAFDAAATEAVFTALRFYALGLVGHASLELAARVFFARQDTVTPLLVAAGIGRAPTSSSPRSSWRRWATAGWRWRTRSQ